MRGSDFRMEKLGFISEINVSLPPRVAKRRRLVSKQAHASVPKSIFII